MTKNNTYIKNRKAATRANHIIDAIIKGDGSEETHERLLNWFCNGVNEDIKLDAFEQALFRHLLPNGQPDEDDRRQFEELKRRLGIESPEPSSNTIKVERKRTIWRVTARVAAVIIPVMLIVGGYLWYDSTRIPADVPEVAAYHISVPCDKHEQLSLKDGTEVVLNGETEFTYGDGRECELRGEGYFKVAKSDELFIIHTDHLDITVLGTEFNLRAYDDSETSILTLYSGSVRIDYESGQYTMQPGKEFIYNNTTGEISMRHVDVAGGDVQPAWLTEMELFQSRSLGLIFTSIESAYGITIENKHVIDTAHVYSFRFDGSEPLDVLLSSLRDASGKFEYTIEGSTVILETVKK